MRYIEDLMYEYANRGEKGNEILYPTGMYNGLLGVADPKYRREIKRLQSIIETFHKNKGGAMIEERPIEHRENLKEMIKNTYYEARSLQGHFVKPQLSRTRNQGFFYQFIEYDPSLQS